MHIKLTLRTDGQNNLLTLNYQYPLSSAIYKILSSSSSEYAKFLHDKGYIGADGKPRKLFTFSRLYILPKPKRRGSKLYLRPQSQATLQIASPMLEDFVQHFVVGLFSNQAIEIANRDSKISFFVEQVETIAEPTFTSPCHFRALSPIVLTTQLDTETGLETHFYRPLEEGLSEAVRESLIGKHQTAYGRPPNDDNLQYEIDQQYLNRKGGPEGVSKLITIREGHDDETKVKAFIAPFTLTGSTELMRTAWECGVGDKGSMGFGCVDVIKRDLKGLGDL